MLLIQAPGSFLTVYYQLFRAHRGASTWLPYLLAGIQQVILIILCAYLRCRSPAASYQEVMTGSEETQRLYREDERSLLAAAPSLNSEYGSLHDVASATSSSDNALSY
jgi:hypothetical protein